MFKQPEIGSTIKIPDVPKPQLKSVTLVQLIATMTLALSTLVAAAAVSIGLEHAGMAATMTGAVPCTITVSPTDGAA